MHSQSPIAKVAGNSSTHKTGNTYNVTPGAVKKEKIRNPAALAYELNHNQNSLNSSSSASKLEHYLENNMEYKSNPTSDHFSDLANEHNGTEPTFSPIGKHQPHDNSRSSFDTSLRSEDLEEFRHRNSCKRSSGNANELHVAETDYTVSALGESSQLNQNANNRPILNDQQPVIQSAASFTPSSIVFESSQCDMAEADQASICSSPEKPTSSTKKNEETFQEVVLTFVQGHANNSKESICSNGMQRNKDDNDSNVADVGDGIVSESLRPSYAMGITSEPGPSNLQTIQSSLQNEDLERRQLEEESESALTVNAIVEEILSSPTNSIGVLVTESDDQKE